MPLVVDNYLLGTPVEQDFWRRTGGVSNGIVVVAASGKVVGAVKDWNLGRLVRAFKELPESDRKPILEKALGIPDPEKMPPVRPPGALTLIIYNTSVDRNARGELVRARGLMGPGPSWRLETPITDNDLLWLRQDEWQGLIPTEAKIGVTGRLPESAQRRLFMFSGYDWGVAYQNDMAPVRSGDLQWVVEGLSETEIRTRLQGFSKVGGTPEVTQQCACKSPHHCQHWGADLCYSGSVTIDRSSQTIKEFRMVAVGETRTKFNRWRMANGAEVQVVPTALVVELASNCAANNNGWPPLAPSRMRRNRINYWDPKK